jgi:hypothetical protein
VWGDNTVAKCPIWGTEAQAEPTTSPTIFTNSPRAGGWYGISTSALPSLEGMDDRTRAKLTTWLVDQHRAGVERPTIMATDAEAARGLRALRYSEKIERFFLWLDQRQFGIGDLLNLNDGPREGQLWHYEIQAWCECASNDECLALMQLLEAEGVLHKQRVAVYGLMAKGYSRLDEVARHRPNTRNAFVAMWFDQSMTDVFDQGIGPALTDAGYAPIRVDRLHHSGKIDDQIIAEIRRARFVVADFTCGTVATDGGAQTIHRGGVYYEAGFAMGLGVPVIWCVRQDQINAVHFDTRQFPHITWTSPAELSEALYNRVAALIGLAPGVPGRTPA